MTATKPILLDVTRMIANSWVDEAATGIDRVCKSYLLHFRSQSLAVVQHRGVHRILTAEQSNTLFDLLVTRHHLFRWKLARLMPQVLNTKMTRSDCEGKTYLNVGHTDFDLQSHWEWLESLGLKSAYLIHDLIPINHPDLTTEHAVRRHLARVQKAVSNADGIITNSQSTTDDLRHFAANNNLSLPPVIEAHLGTDHIPEVAAERQLDQPYFVYVSTIEARKNHQLLLHAWKKLAGHLLNRTPKLVLIGQWGFQAEQVQNMLSQEPELAQNVIVINQCDDAEMVRWVQSAHAVLIPSFAEGFGLPLAEAMALGTPAIVSNLPCFREIGRDIPVYVSATDAAGWEAAIVAFMKGSSEADRQRALLSQHRPTTWAMHFKSVDDWVAALPARRFLERSVRPPQERTVEFIPFKSHGGAR